MAATASVQSWSQCLAAGQIAQHSRSTVHNFHTSPSVFGQTVRLTCHHILGPVKSPQRYDLDNENVIFSVQELHGAGLTHVHLLPTYDYGSVPEKQDDQQVPEV